MPQEVGKVETERRGFFVFVKVITSGRVRGPYFAYVASLIMHPRYNSMAYRLQSFLAVCKCASQPHLIFICIYHFSFIYSICYEPI